MATIKELKRMCKSSTCKDCPLSNEKGNDCFVYSTPDCYPDKDIDAIVDKWVTEHPVKTYAMDFFEKFPNNPKNRNGIPTTRSNIICRRDLYAVVVMIQPLAYGDIWTKL